MKQLHLSNPNRRGAAPGALVWIVVLLVAFFISLGVAIISGNDAEEARAQRDAANAARDSAAAQLETELATIRDISELLGFYDADAASARSEKGSAAEALQTFKDSFSDMGATVTTFEMATTRAVPEYRAKVVKINDLTSRISDLEAQVSSKTTAMDALRSEKDAEIAAKSSQLRDAEQAAADRQSDIEGQLANVRTSLTDSESKLRKVRSEVEVQKRSNDQERSMMQARAEEQGRKLAFLKEPEAADGEVLAVNEDLGLAWINVGQKNRLQRGTRFRIVDGTPGDEHLKAWCTVTRVEESMAEVFFIDQVDIYDPVVAGDIIYNPVYDSKSVRNAALVGRFSGSWNEKELRLLLAEVGIEVQDGVDKTTDYLIVGSAIYMDEDGEPLEEPRNPNEEPVYSNAVAMGVQIVPIKQIREYFLTK
jgi:predicted  nucleic acid-binding Zn-ribbon protein